MLCKNNPDHYIYVIWIAYSFTSMFYLQYFYYRRCKIIIVEMFANYITSFKKPIVKLL